MKDIVSQFAKRPRRQS